MSVLTLIEESVSLLKDHHSQKGLLCSQDSPSSIKITDPVNGSRLELVIEFKAIRSLLDFLGETYVTAACVILKEPNWTVEEFFANSKFKKALIAALLEIYDQDFVNRIYKNIPGIIKLTTTVSFSSFAIKKYDFYEKIQKAVQVIHLDYVQVGENYGLYGPSYDTIKDKFFSNPLS